MAATFQPTVEKTGWTVHYVSGKRGRRSRREHNVNLALAGLVRPRLLKFAAQHIAARRGTAQRLVGP